jgi:hypothetical protein
MPRINIDLDFLTHRKTISTSPLAQLLFIRSLIYAATHLTDGFIPQAATSLLSFDLTQYTKEEEDPIAPCGQRKSVSVSTLISELLQAKRWKVFKGGYLIHDYLDYQLSRQQVSELMEKKRQSGQAGGRASAQARATASAQPDAQAQSKQRGKRNPSRGATIVQRISTPIPIPIPIPIPEEKTKILVSPPKGDKSGDKSGKGLTRLSVGLKKLFQDKLPPLEEETLDTLREEPAT